MRDPELWERLKSRPFADAFVADVVALQNGDAQAANDIIEALRKWQYLSSVSETPVAVPTALAPVWAAYRKSPVGESASPKLDANASHGELLALYQLEFGEAPPARFWGEKAVVPENSGIRPMAWLVAGVFAACGVILSILGQWWFFLPILAGLLLLAGFGKKALRKPGFHYDVPFPD